MIWKVFAVRKRTLPLTFENLLLVNGTMPSQIWILLQIEGQLKFPLQRIYYFFGIWCYCRTENSEDENYVQYYKPKDSYKSLTTFTSILRYNIFYKILPS